MGNRKKLNDEQIPVQKLVLMILMTSKLMCKTIDG